MRPAVAARLESFLALQALEPGWESVEQACNALLRLAEDAWAPERFALYFRHDEGGWAFSNRGDHAGTLVQADPVAFPQNTALNGNGPVRDARADGSGDYVAIPLKSGGRTLGAMVLGWAKPLQDLESQFLLMQLAAWHLAGLIASSEADARMRRQTEAQAQLERLKAFTEISMLINGHGELGPLLDAVAELAARLLDASFAFTGLLQSDGTYRVIPEAGHWGLSDKFIAKFTTVPGRGLHHHAITTGAPVASGDVYSDDRAANPYIREEGFRAEIVAPLMVGDRPIGILAAGQRMPREWTEDEIAVLKFLSSQAASAIDRARALDELRALDHLKDEILGIASHELRTPLTAIKGFAAILASDPGDLERESARKYAHIIDIEADRMIRLVDDMLNVSRIESGRVTLEVNPVNVLDLVEQAIFASWGTSGDRIELEVDERIETMADSDQVVRILANLLENARKYSDPGARVAVRANVDADKVEIRVWNEGESFAPGETEQLFRKFSRLGRHRASGARGAGLGLYIARQLIGAMGGQLWVEATPGGPTFAFSLPPVKVAAKT